MSDFNNKKMIEYSIIRKKNSDNQFFQCPYCHQSFLVQDAQLVYTHYDKIEGVKADYSNVMTPVYAYRICSDCKNKKDAKEARNEIRHDKFLKYIGISAWVWGIVLLIGIAFAIFSRIFSITINDDIGDAIMTFYSFWFAMPIPITVLVVIFFVIAAIYGNIYLPIKSKIKPMPKDGIDFDEALSRNAVHWYP